MPDPLAQHLPECACPDCVPDADDRATIEQLRRELDAERLRPAFLGHVLADADPVLVGPFGGLRHGHEWLDDLDDDGDPGVGALPRLTGDPTGALLVEPPPGHHPDGCGCDACDPLPW